MSSSLAPECNEVKEYAAQYLLFHSLYFTDYLLDATIHASSSGTAKVHHAPLPCEFETEANLSKNIFEERAQQMNVQLYSKITSTV